MGTEFNKQLGVFRAILDGLAGEPCDVVVTVGPSGDPEALRPFADNVRVERFIPQSSILPRCRRLRVARRLRCHARRAQRRRADARDPQGADQFLNAERSSTRASGCG